MIEHAADPAHESPTTWSRNTPHVRKALAFLKRRGNVTADELVAWDARNGRRLFDWDDPSAAGEWRKQQARMFLNRFRGKFDGMRVRAIIHVREDEENQIDKSAYYTVETISQHKGMRDQVVGDITRRMKSLASELKMWNLSHAEQGLLFDQLREAMNGGVQQDALGRTA